MTCQEGPRLQRWEVWRAVHRKLRGAKLGGSVTAAVMYLLHIRPVVSGGQEAAEPWCSCMVFTVGAAQALCVSSP